MPDGVRFDPRSLIGPPFKACPHCGAEAGLGVLSVEADRVVHRCRECLRPGPGEPSDVTNLPRVRKRVLYLDQFAISNAMYHAFAGLDPERHARATAIWQPVFQRIQILVRAQVLVCPTSDFHTDEALPFRHRAELQQTWTTLAGGTTFEHHTTIESNQLIRSAELWARDEPQSIVEILRDEVISPSPHEWTPNLHVTINLGFYDGIAGDIATARTSGAQLLREALHGWAEHRPTFAEQFERELASYGPAIIQSVISFEEEKHDFWDGKSSSPPLPSNPALRFKALVRMLEKKGYDEGAATHRAVEYLQSDAVSEVPKVRLAALLYSGIARKVSNGMNPNVNDGMATDVAMVSTILPYCDAIVVDGFVAGLLNEQPTKATVGSYRSLVIGSSQRDELVSWLDGVAADVSEEHLAAVTAAYGPDVGNAFRDTFRS